jgi:hypothetical protein
VSVGAPRRLAADDIVPMRMALAADGGVAFRSSFVTVMIWALGYALGAGEAVPLNRIVDRNLIHLVSTT